MRLPDNTPVDDLLLAQLGVLPGHGFWVDGPRPWMALAMQGWAVFIPLDDAQQAELRDDGFLLRPLLCLGHRHVGPHTHPVALALPQQ